MSTFWPRFALSVFGLGLVPVGRGTTASIGSFTALFLLRDVLPESVMLRFVFLFVLFAIGMMAYFPCIRRLPEDEQHDPHWVVLDEVLAMILLMIPFYVFDAHPQPVIASMFAFGFFDVFKPLGIKKIDARDTHWSILVDDWLAAVAAMVTVYASYFAYLSW